VLAGVVVAVGLATAVGLSWWSLGAVVAVTLVLGQILRLGPHTVEVPISAMLVARTLCREIFDRTFYLPPELAGEVYPSAAPPGARRRSRRRRPQRWTASPPSPAWSPVA
jgi:hypothetical protein